MNRALKEQNSDCWINGRRRDHGAERAALPVWEGKKLNPLAFWSFEDCWSYLRKHNVPYHPLHDVGFSSLGDMHSTKKVGTLHLSFSAKQSYLHSWKEPKIIYRNFRFPDFFVFSFYYDLCRSTTRSGSPTAVSAPAVSRIS